MQVDAVKATQGNHFLVEEEPSYVSHIAAGSHVSHVETICAHTIAVTSDPPPLPPLIKLHKDHDLFDTMFGLLSATYAKFWDNDKEEIEEVEEVKVGLGCNCCNQLKKAVQKFLLSGSVCNYYSVIVLDHVHRISSKGEATSLNMDHTTKHPKPYSSSKPSCGQLMFTSIIKKRSTTTIDLLCNEDVSKV
jgi:hypothetical protein